MISLSCKKKEEGQEVAAVVRSENNTAPAYSDAEGMKYVLSLLDQSVREALDEKYGKDPDPLITRRIWDEKRFFAEKGALPYIAQLHELTLRLRERGLPWFVNLSGGSSLILYLLGILRGDPLPPHYYDTGTKEITFADVCCRDGLDLEDSFGVIGDGHDIPWQLMFPHRNGQLGIDLRVPADLYDEIRAGTDSLLLFRNGIRRDPSSDSPEDRIIRLVKGVNIICCIPEEEVQRWDGTHEFAPGEKRALIMQNWRIFAGRDPEHPDRDDLWDGYPEPESVADVIYMNGLSHSRSGRDDVTRMMLDKMGYSYSDLIAFKEDYFRYLTDHGMKTDDAVRETIRARFGTVHGSAWDHVPPGFTAARDKWVLSRVDASGYLWSKECSVEHILYKMRLMVK